MPFQLPVSIQTKIISSEGTTIYYPRITGLVSKVMENQLNHVIFEQVQALIHEQGKYQIASPKKEMIGHYEIKTNERGILSLTISNYAYSYPMAHGFTLLASLTFDVNTGKQYQLSELFQPGADYVGVLSRNIATQIRARNLPLLQPFHSIARNQSYYLADKALVIYFRLYEITPNYVGFPMFPISVYEVQSMIPDKSPLSVLAADIA